MANVFISYQRGSAATAAKVVAGLRAAGHQSWSDAELPLDRSYAEVIEERLTGADRVLVLWTVAAAGSQWVRAEAEFARERGKLVQARLDTALPPIPFNQIQCADLSAWSGSRRHGEWRKVLASLDQPATAQIPPRPLSPTPAAPSRRRPMWAAIAAGIAVAVLAAAAFAWWRLGGEPQGLAVESLKATAGDAPAQAVRLGLSGELAHALGGNPAGVAVDQVGDSGIQSHHAALVVSGDVATIGDRLQAHVQIRNARSGAILWANDFVGDPNHPDVVQEQIATTADAVINCALSARHGGKAAISDEADRLYLTACDLVEQYRLDEALEPFRQVAILEPRFARALADLATTEAFTTDRNDPAHRATEYREAAATARRALAIDPNTGLAYYALAQTMPGISNWQQRVDIIARGLKVEPSGSELNNAMAQELCRVGRVHEAITYFRRSMAADPLGPVKTGTLFTALAFDGQLDEAERLIDRALRLWPRNIQIWQLAFSVELLAGDPNRAQAMIDAPDHLGLRDAKGLEQARQWLLVRRSPTARNIAAVTTALLAETSADPRQDQLPAALRIAELGQIDTAYRLALDPAGAMDENNDEQLFRSGLSRFRADPRFMILAARRGLVPIWQATHVGPDFCAGANLQTCAQNAGATRR